MLTNRLLVGAMLISAALFMGCSADDSPDVRKINVPMEVQRYEQDFFTMDTSNTTAALDALDKKYPSFNDDFLSKILRADRNWGGDTLQVYINGFIQFYKPVYDSVKLRYPTLDAPAADVKKGMQFVKYYFPSYNLPTKMISFVGPLDGFGDVMTEEAFLIGLQHHLGSEASIYSTQIVAQTYPAYITRNFDEEHIAINAMKNILLDIVPINDEDKSLVVQMVNRGKTLYALEKLLPKEEKHRLIGYSKNQYEESLSRQAAIWDFFLQNNMLQSKDGNLNKNYIGENPKTQELGDASPGNIGAFMGWQIVRTFAGNNKEIPLSELLKMDAEKIYAAAKYKP